MHVLFGCQKLLLKSREFTVSFFLIFRSLMLMNRRAEHQQMSGGVTELAEALRSMSRDRPPDVCALDGKDGHVCRRYDHSILCRSCRHYQSGKL